jgi:hypothetical protein
MEVHMFSISGMIAVALSAAWCGVVAVRDDPARKFIEEMDKAPAEERVPHWEQVKTLMARVAPAVGDSAPDFSLKTLDGKATVTLSSFKGEKPVVLIFGSYT